MKAVPCTVLIPAPKVLHEGSGPPGTILARTLVSQLCRTARIPMRVSGGEDAKVVCITSRRHFLGADGTYYVGATRAPRTRVGALRVLEVLAHSFHDYAARESVCNRGLFSAPVRPRGRPRTGPIAMTPRERMAAMRTRRALAR